MNKPPYDAVDASALSTKERIVQSAAVTDYNNARAKAEAHLFAHGVRLVKGRWLARYLHTLVKSHLSDDVVRANVRADAVIDAALMDLAYEGAWASRYETQYAELIAST